MLALRGLSGPGVRYASTFVLIAGLLLRAAVAPGYMFDREPESGAVVVRVCGGANPGMMMAMEAPGGGHHAGGPMPGHDGHQSGTDTFCPFAVAIATAPPPGRVAVVEPRPRLPGSVDTSPRARVFVHSEPVDGPLSARGPPLRG